MTLYNSLNNEKKEIVDSFKSTWKGCSGYDEITYGKFRKSECNSETPILVTITIYYIFIGDSLWTNDNAEIILHNMGFEDNDEVAWKVISPYIKSFEVDVWMEGE